MLANRTMGKSATGQMVLNGSFQFWCETMQVQGVFRNSVQLINPSKSSIPVTIAVTMVTRWDHWDEKVVEGDIRRPSPLRLAKLKIADNLITRFPQTKCCWGFSSDDDISMISEKHSRQILGSSIPMFVKGHKSHMQIKPEFIERVISTKPYIYQDIFSTNSFIPLHFFHRMTIISKLIEQDNYKT